MKLTDKEIETALRAHKYIRRKIWEEDNYSISYSNAWGRFLLHVGESEMRMELDDFFADDWEVLK